MGRYATVRATEMRARLGRFDFAYFAGNWLRTLIGGLYFAFNQEGSHYLDRLVQLSDTLRTTSAPADA